MTGVQRRARVAQIEEFFVDEAALLDEWRLDEWLKLMTPQSRYLVPSLDSPTSDHQSALFLIADDYTTIKSRVAQLNGRATWSENPRSRTRRLLGGFRLLREEGNVLEVTANFAVWRFQHEQTDVYVGKYLHRLIPDGDSFKFLERRTVLDLQALRPHGKLSFIL